MRRVVGDVVVLVLVRYWGLLVDGCGCEVCL